MPVPAARDLLRWYDRHRRAMPWRAPPGRVADPYHVWLSEIMLQQTTVAAVVPFFERFLALFPTVEALAAAPEDRVLGAWAGLGYYARARNLHRCAQAVTALGGFPRDLDGLRALPGIGAYTAPAIAAIAFGVPAVPVDGNVERVCARLFAVDAPLPGARRRLAVHAAELGADPEARARPSDFAQALFDLGATICTPRRPACALCPWQEPCLGRRAGNPETLPVKAAKRERPTRYGAAFVPRDGSGAVLLRRRPPRGLLGGMSEPFGTPWRVEPWSDPDSLAAAPFPAPWRRGSTVRHGFTHFPLEVTVWTATVATIPVPAGGFLRRPAELETEALPTLMRKLLAG